VYIRAVVQLCYSISYC